MKLQSLIKSTPWKSITVIAATAILLQIAPTLAHSQAPPAPDNSNTSGMSLAEWQELYFRWRFGQVTLPLDENGNAVADGHVVLMPLPNAPGDGTPGSVDVDLDAGQAFVLPLWVWLGTSYLKKNTPDDQYLDASIFQTLDLTLEIDGYAVIDGDNAFQYFSQFPFDPTIPINASGIEDIIFFQGVGMTHPPLTAGEHVITLDVVNTIPIVVGHKELFIEYHNTWHVTVEH